MSCSTCACEAVETLCHECQASLCDACAQHLEDGRTLCATCRGQEVVLIMRQQLEEMLALAEQIRTERAKTLVYLATTLEEAKEVNVSAKAHKERAI